jgi:hypothetical protein
LKYFFYFTPKVDLKNLVQTMIDLKTNRMLELAEKLGFNDKLNNENLTIFSPTDEALIEFQDDHNKQEVFIVIERINVKSNLNLNFNIFLKNSIRMRSESSQ